jgi:hypothetical protein
VPELKPKPVVHFLVFDFSKQARIKDWKAPPESVFQKK